MPSRSLTVSLCALAVTCSPIPARRPAAQTTAPSVPAGGQPAAPVGPSRPPGVGSGSVHALFDGADDEVVLARCEQTVAAYLPTAPQVPLIGFGSAAHVTTPCQPCQ